MGPIILVANALLGSFAGLKMLGTAVVGMHIWANARIADEAMRNYRLGLNPVFEKIAFMYETKKQQMFQMGDFTKFLYKRVTFEASELPVHMAHLAHEWCLNREEYEKLCLMIRQDQIDAHSGEEWDKFQAVWASINTPEGQESFERLCHTGRPSYLYLNFVSKNRLADEKFMVVADALNRFTEQKEAA